MMKPWYGQNITPSHVKVARALLRLQSAIELDIAMSAGLKRSTTHVRLFELHSVGLARKVGVDERRFTVWEISEEVWWALHRVAKSSNAVESSPEPQNGQPGLS